MTQIKRVVLVMALGLILVLTALPTFAAAANAVTANVDGCILYVSVNYDTSNVYVTITGMVDPIDEMVSAYTTHEFPINAAPGTDIIVTAYWDAAHTILLGTQTVVAPDGCYNPPAIPATDECPYPPSPLLGQLQIPGTVETYWTPRLNAATADPNRVIVAPGSTWWVLEARNGFYKIYIACWARYVWVIADQTIPNPQYPWNGAPLPDAGEIES